MDFKGNNTNYALRNAAAQRQEKKFKILRIGFFGHIWPFNLFNLMQQTVSENFIYNFSDTLSVSYIFCTSKVKNLKNMNNPQVTKASNSQVGTSEAIRLLTIDNIKNNKWNQ